MSEVRLLSRISCSSNIVVQVLIAEAGGARGTWMHAAAAQVDHMIPDVCSMGKGGWEKIVSQHKSLMDEADARTLMRQSEVHTNLKSYKPAWSVQAVCLGLNRTLHNNKLDPYTARSINRLLVGGQGLQGGDPTEEVAPSIATCCLHCLRQGRMCVELLRHVAFECDAYDDCRRPVAELTSKEASSLFVLCRDRWTWVQLRAIIRFFQRLIRERARVWGTNLYTDGKLISEIERRWRD